MVRKVAKWLQSHEARRALCLAGFVGLIHFCLVFVAHGFSSSLLWLLPCVSAVCGAGLSILVWRLALQRPEQFLGSAEAIEAFPDPVVICDDHLQIQALNPATLRVFGQEMDELMGCPLEVILQSAHSLVLEAAKLEANSGQLRMTGFHADKALMQFDVTWCKYQQGLASRFLLVMNPVAESQRGQRIYQSLLEGTVLTVGEGFFPTLCQRMADSFDASIAFVGEFRGLHAENASLVTLCVDGRLQGAFAPSGMDIAWKQLLEKGFVYVPQDLRQQFPKSQWLRDFKVESCMLVPIKDVAGKIIGVLGLMHNEPMVDRVNDATILSVFSARAAVELTYERNFSELETAQNIAEGATRTKTALLSTLSHEIRTLMTSILGFADFLECSSNESQQSKLALDAIRRNGKQLLQVIKNADETSSLDNTELTASIGCSPQDILAKAVAAIRPCADQSSITVNQEFNALTPLFIETNPDRVHDVLSTMLAFAALRSEGREIRVFADMEHGGIEFGVTDSGESLSPTQLKSLVDPLCADAICEKGSAGAAFVGDQARDGLANCQRIARLLGGTLGAETSPGEGVTLKLRLPLPQSIEPLPAVNSPPRSFLEDRRILLVEDQPDNMQLLQMLLEDEGATVHCAEDGLQGSTVALYALRSGRPYDLILMDMQMPVMDGYEATRLLRNQDYEHPIVAVTADSLSGDRERSLMAGCDDYVSKPIDSEVLMETLYRRLSAPAIEAERSEQLNPVY